MKDSLLSRVRDVLRVYPSAAQTVGMTNDAIQRAWRRPLRGTLHPSEEANAELPLLRDIPRRRSASRPRKVPDIYWGETLELVRRYCPGVVSSAHEPATS